MKRKNKETLERAARQRLQKRRERLLLHKIIVNMASAGYNKQQIAKALHCGRVTVYRTLQNVGMHIPKEGVHY